MFFIIFYQLLYLLLKLLLRNLTLQWILLANLGSLIVFSLILGVDGTSIILIGGVV